MWANFPPLQSPGGGERAQRALFFSTVPLLTDGVSGVVGFFCFFPAGWAGGGTQQPGSHGLNDR